MMLSKPLKMPAKTFYYCDDMAIGGERLLETKRISKHKCSHKYNNSGCKGCSDKIKVVKKYNQHNKACDLWEPYFEQEMGKLKKLSEADAIVLKGLNERFKAKDAEIERLKTELEKANYCWGKATERNRGWKESNNCSRCGEFIIDDEMPICNNCAIKIDKELT